MALEISGVEKIEETGEDEKQKSFAWQVSSQKGKTRELNFYFLVPKISPQFYLFGPLTFREQDEKITMNSQSGDK